MSLESIVLQSNKIIGYSKLKVARRSRKSIISRGKWYFHFSPNWLWEIIGICSFANCIWRIERKIA